MISLPAQVTGDRQSGGTRTDDRHLFFPIFDFRNRKGFEIRPVGCKPFQIADGHGFIHIHPTACCFARVRTDPAQNTGQGQSLHDQFDGFPVFSLSDQLHISLNVYARRACLYTGRPIFFVDAKRDGNRLGKGAIDGFPGLEGFIPFAVQRDRADTDTVPAAGADPFLDVAWFSSNRYRKVSHISGDFFHFAVRQQFYIRILCHLHHLRGTDTGGTIEGRKRLVKLQHVAADGGFALHQVDLVAGPADVKGCLHPGNSAAHHHDVRMNRNLPLF